MRCNVPNCTSKSSNSTKRDGITFHKFPTEEKILNAWLKSLRLTSYDTIEDHVICSEHFDEKDFYLTNQGFRKIHYDAVPVYLVCRICLVMDKKMILLEKYNKLFEDVTGIPSDDEDSRLPQRICWECAARLTAAANFRAKALLSDGMLHDLLTRESDLKFSDLKSIKRVIRDYGFESKLKQVTFDVDHFDMNIRDTYVDTKLAPDLEQDYIDKDLHEIIDDDENVISNDETVSNNEMDDEPQFANNEIDINVNEFTNTEYKDEKNESSDCKVEVPVVRNARKRFRGLRIKDKVSEEWLSYNKKDGVTIYNIINSTNKIPEELSPLKPHFTITPLSQEQQLQEIEERKERDLFLSAPYKCTICNKVFADKERCDAHMVNHDQNMGSYQCGICKKFKSNAKKMREHMKMHSFIFACNQCDLRTRHRQVAQGHVKFHEGDKSTCPHCFQKFTRRTSCQSHIRLKHMSDTVCDLCGYTYINDFGLRQHKLKAHRHIVDNPPSFEGPHCDKCDVTFLSQEAYVTHLRCSSKHLDGESDPIRIRNDRGKPPATSYPVKCEQCGLKCNTIRSYKLHFRNDHPGISPTKRRKNERFICEQCGKTFASKLQLDCHQWMHTGQKLYQCNDCDKSFSQKTCLSSHIEVFHLNIKHRYNCKMCGRSYAFKPNLARHIKHSHTNQRPWKCQLCSRKFVFRAELKSHVDYIHNKKPYPKRKRVKKKKVKKTEELE